MCYVLTREQTENAKKVSLKVSKPIQRKAG